MITIRNLTILVALPWRFPCQIVCYSISHIPGTLFFTSLSDERPCYFTCFYYPVFWWLIVQSVRLGHISSADWSPDRSLCQYTVAGCVIRDLLFLLTHVSHTNYKNVETSPFLRWPSMLTSDINPQKFQKIFSTIQFLKWGKVYYTVYALSNLMFRNRFIWQLV